VESNLTTLVLPAFIALIVSVVTVFLTDYFGLRRDRERLRLELDWKYRDNRMLALFGLLKDAPTFYSGDMQPDGTLDFTRTWQSILAFMQWVEQSVEPWLDSNDREKVYERRLKLNDWTSSVLEAGMQPINAASVGTDRVPGRTSVTIPAEDINQLRRSVMDSIRSALNMERNDALSVTKKSNW
jgi:hypothetical protein